MAVDDTIYFHHYDTSPFSEKVRLMFGLKGASWRSVIQPSIMPKPELTPLTGGYRRAPVMQIGADVFCDSQVILEELERRFPAPAAEIGGAGYAVNLWADRLFFQPTVAIIFGEIGDNVPKEFKDDREKLSGRPFDTAQMKAAVKPMTAQWQAMASWVEHPLGQAAWLSGDKLGLADISAYMNFWFMSNFAPATSAQLLKPFPRIRDWMERVKAIGHGKRTESNGQEALAAAKAASPGDLVKHDETDSIGVAKGARVIVMADDYGRDPIDGALVAATQRRIVIARDTPDLGRINVHFPRAGFIAVPAG